MNTMNNKKFMVIDGLPVAIEGEKNILEGDTKVKLQIDR